MLLRLIFFSFLFAQGASSEAAADYSETVSWTLGTSASSLDGGASSGPVTFIWTFNKPVRHGVYLDGTPWVVWQEGLRLIEVSPSCKKETLLQDKETGGVLNNAIVDATCISPGENLLPLDQRMGAADGTGAPWGGGAGVWNESPADLVPGDCIVTGYGRRDARASFRKMMFNAIGVCNVVSRDMTGHYRPPIRMPRELRAVLETPVEVDIATLPSFNLIQPKDWKGGSVSLNLSSASGSADADSLLNGPIANCGLYSHVWYEPANGTLNHNLSGKDDTGYQRDVAVRFAICLYTAFDPDEDEDKRQRSLNKFIQTGLDYYYMHCLGYKVWNGGGGHPNGLEGAIMITGALLGNAEITDSIKFQRFRGGAVGRPDKVYDMLSGSTGDFSRSEALHTISSADWLSGDFVRRDVGTGASTLDECYIRIDMTREDHVLNNQNVPYTKISSSPGSNSLITVSSGHIWPMYSLNAGTERSRSYRFLPGTVVRLQGDGVIRKVLDFRADATTAWTESSWNSAGGKGGVLVVYPPLSTDEIQNIGQSGSLTTGICTKQESESDAIVLWESWPADSESRAVKSFITTPTQDYLDNKLGDHFRWLPYYHLLDDPGAPGKKLYEEDATYHQVKTFVKMQRDFGSHFWSTFISGSSLPKTPTIQALVRHYLLDGVMPDTYCKTYSGTDKMWNDPE